MSERIAGRSFLSAVRIAGCFLLGIVLWQAAAPALAQVVVTRPYWYYWYGPVDRRLSYALSCRILAEARYINAEAYSLELDNWLKFVEVYWQRKNIFNEQYRKAHPKEWEIEKERQIRLRQRVEDQYQAVLRREGHHVTVMMNWLLRELSNSAVSYQYAMGEKELGQGEFNPKLAKDELKLIRLTDGGLGNERLIFSAADGKVALPKWPFALRGHECDEARNEFDAAREAVIKELQTTATVSHEGQTRLIKAVNGLYIALDAAYPKEKRLADTKVYSLFNAGKNAVRTLQGQTNRIIAINEASVFDEKMRFEGDSLFGLIQHMYRKGLEFAPPEPGAEGFYKTMFEYLRQMYLRIGQDRLEAVPPGKADNAR